MKEYAVVNGRKIHSLKVLIYLLFGDLTEDCGSGDGSCGPGGSSVHPFGWGEHPCGGKDARNQLLLLIEHTQKETSFPYNFVLRDSIQMHRFPRTRNHKAFAKKPPKQTVLHSPGELENLFPEVCATP